MTIPESLDRHPAGSDVGGQFAPRTRTEPAARLVDVKPQNIAFPEFVNRPQTADEVLRFAFEESSVSPQVLSNAKTSYARWRYDTARARAQRWIDEEWTKTETFKELSDKYAAKKIDRSTIQQRTLNEQAWRVVLELREINPSELLDIYAETAVRAGQAWSIAGSLPPEEKQKLMAHELHFYGKTELIPNFVRRYNLDRPSKWLDRALTESDLMVADRLERSSLLAVDEAGADLERRIQKELRVLQDRQLLA